MKFFQLGIYLLVDNLADHFQKFHALVCIPAMTFDSGGCIFLGISGHNK